jgi:hypothetical protein
MGLFDRFRKKIIEDKVSDEEKIMYYYVYGFVKSDPNYSFKDQDFGDKLFKKVIGEKGAIIIGNSLHPYCLVDKDAVSIWDYAFLYLLQNVPTFREDLINKERFLLELSSKFNQVILWEDDTRLTFEDNPIFGRAVPFVIPFVVFDKTRDTNFDKMISIELKQNGHAHKYLNEVNLILKEFMHESVFTLGFDEFKRENKNQVIENFIQAKGLMGA